MRVGPLGATTPVSRARAATVAVWLLGAAPTLAWASESAQTIQNLLRGRTSTADEARILDVLRQIPDHELSAVVLKLDVPRLFDALDDHLRGPNHRAQGLKLLYRDRIEHLTPAARAHLIDGLQEGRTDDQAERAIVDLFLGTRGPELTELKNRVDAGGDHRDLMQLIFHDIDNGSGRAEILRHLEAEAQARVAKGGPIGLKVLSDVDDTLFASLNDERYPKGTTYPGVVALYETLVGRGDERGTHLAFLTARPWDRAGWVEAATQETLAERGVGPHVVISGDLTHLTSHERMAQKKLENFRRYQQLFGEYEFLFIGDNGQGDVRLGRGMREEFPERVRAVFIHEVVPSKATKKELAGDRARHIFHVPTYAHAFLLALEHGWIPPDGAKRGLDRLTGELKGFPETVRALHRKPLDQLKGRLR